MNLIIFSIIALLVLVLTGFGTLNLYYYNSDANEEAVNLFIKSKHRVPDIENSYYSLIGFNAPHDVIDIHAFGLDLAKQTITKNLAADNKHLPLETYLPSIENDLTLDMDINKLVCWFENNSTITESICIDGVEVACYTPDELSIVVDNNHVLLQRHEELKKYTKFENISLLSHNMQLIINTHRLYLANIRHSLQIGRKDVFRILIDDIKYRRALIGQSGTLIDKAINLLLYSLSLDQLDFAITNYTDVAHKYDADLKNVLSDLSTDEYGLDNMFREEFEIINSVFCIDETLGIETNDYCQDDINLDSLSANYIINNFYEYYLDNKNMFDLDFDSMVKQCNIYSNEKKPNNYLGALLHLPIYQSYLAYSMLKSKMGMGCELMGTYKSKTTKHRKLMAFLYGES